MQIFFRISSLLVVTDDNLALAFGFANNDWIINDCPFFTFSHCIFTVCKLNIVDLLCTQNNQTNSSTFTNLLSSFHTDVLSFQ